MIATFHDVTAEKLAEEPEGGRRCLQCFALRLGETARVAATQGYPYFTTTLSVSPHKNAEILNQIGQAAGEKYGVKYLMADFKKKNGYKRSVELSKEYDLYRQDYCGCIFSKAERENGCSSHSSQTLAVGLRKNMI